MTSLIIGRGEVGKSLWEVLTEVYDVDIIDKDEEALDDSYDIIHICFPYSKDFKKNVKEYQEKYKPKYTIIHSTIPRGTSRNLNALHSPIRGLHPHLAEGIKTFTKFIGGAEASGVADYFRKAGIKVTLCDKQETTEALKLWDTQYYLECVRFVKRVKRYCDKHDLPFSEIYRLSNLTYNEGYARLGHIEFTRPILEPIMTEVGGHCLLPNERLLDE